MMFIKVSTYQCKFMHMQKHAVLAQKLDITFSVSGCNTM